MAEALLDDDDDKVLNVLTLDAFGGCDMCNGLALTAVDSDTAVIANRLSVTRTALQVFFDPDAISSASLRISPSIVSLPRRRYSPFNWF